MPADSPDAAPEGAFVMTRVFDAPLSLVWAAWSQPEQIQSWWGPKGCTIEVATFEFRPGGFFHYAMAYENGTRMWGRFVYRNIEPLARIVWLNSFSNAGCGITRAPYGPSVPLEILNNVAFTEQRGKTSVRLWARPHGAEESEVAFFEGMYASLNQGYGGTLDRLASVLAKA